LITNSYLVACSTGRSAGLAPYNVKAAMRGVYALPHGPTLAKWRLHCGNG
jgi:hypothetical protein